LVEGKNACFTRPEMKAERVSYDVMTPSAARGILEAVFWHPGLRWKIDAITVLKEIQFDAIRRNELGSKIPLQNITSAMKGGEIRPQIISEDRQQRATLCLRDVAYVIDAHFDLLPDKMNASDNAGKFRECFTRRARKGQCYHRPYLGCREFAASFSLIEEESARPESHYANEASRDLGWMLWDLIYKAETDKSGKGIFSFEPRFFRAEMKRGVIAVPDLSEVNA
jgi:CRISPR-associated protein Cas5 subtype I-C